MWRTKFLIVAFIGLLGIAAVGLGVATSFGPGDSYPVRPITVVVPFPAGGPSDVVARVVTEQMGKILGQSLVIENVGGGGGTIGSARVAAAPSDGYTLLAGSMGSHVSAPVLTPNLKYDSERDSNEDRKPMVVKQAAHGVFPLCTGSPRRSQSGNPSLYT